MSTPNTTRWIGIGLLGLPLYGVLTFFSTWFTSRTMSTMYRRPMIRYIPANPMSVKSPDGCRG